MTYNKHIRTIFIIASLFVANYVQAEPDFYLDVGLGASINLEGVREQENPLLIAKGRYEWEHAEIGAFHSSSMADGIYRDLNDVTLVYGAVKIF